MKNRDKSYQLVWVLLIIAVVMAIIKIRYGYKGDKVTPLLISPTPTEIIEATPTVATSSATILKVDESKYPLWQELPYLGLGFTVEKYSDVKVLLARLNGVDVTTATKAINVWLESFGEAGKGHKIEFEN